MLAKMGYKEGEGIGKSVKGRVAPIAVDLKSGRTGLGVDEGKKRQREAAKVVKQAQGVKVCACAPLNIFCAVDQKHTLRQPGRTQNVQASLLCADAKRRRSIEDLRSGYITKQAASFADRQAERHLAQARKVHVFQLLHSTSSTRAWLRSAVCVLSWIHFLSYWDAGLRNARQEEGYH